MISRLITLLWHDLAVAFKNKSLYLVVFIPFFVFITLKLVEPKGGNYPNLKIGLVQNEQYAPEVVRGLQSAGKAFTLVWVSSESEGQSGLRLKKLDGLLLKADTEPARFVLWVLKKESLQTVALIAGLSVLQRAAEGGRPDWVSEVKALQTGGVQKQSLPTWVLMLILLVSFVVLPVQVAEEKEKKIILGLLQTPMRETEWLLAKLFLGISLSLGAVMLLHALGGFGFGKGLGYFVFLGVGGFCFSSFGILLGCLCRNQSSARTLGVIFYLPFLLPSALSDYSPQLLGVSSVLPSYWFYAPIKSMLLEGGRIASFIPDLGYLGFVGLIAFGLSYRLLKKRWLM